MTWHAGIPPRDWDTALFAANGHFLQSSHWAAFNNALDKPTFFASGKNWQCLALLERTRTGTRLYCPYGPVATTKSALAAALLELSKLARSHHALFVRIEPQAPVTASWLSTHNLKPALKDIQPAQTWALDLTQSSDQILAGFTATNRNLYRNFAAKGLGYRVSHDPQDIHIFLTMIHDVAANTGMKPHSDHYYTTMAEILLPRGAASLYIGEHDGTAVAAAFVFDSLTTRYYTHAGNLLRARKLHPGTPLLATMIFDAQKNGQKTFDFVGVAPPNQPEHRWAGFTKFKQSFGGYYKQYLGTWELPTHPLYRLYRGVYQAKKIIR